MKNINQKKGGRMDSFLRSVLEPAAEVYMDELIFCAKHPESTIPPQLDKKCRDIIAGKPCCLLKSIIKVIMVAAVSVSMMAASSFAVYTGVKQGLLMKLETEPEGSRISFVGEDVEPAPALSTPGKIQLSYIPDGFECVKKTDDYVRYADKNNNSILFMSTKRSSKALLFRDTENANVTYIIHKDCEGYKNVKYRDDGLLCIEYLWFDSQAQLEYDLITIGLDETEITKILEGMGY